MLKKISKITLSLMLLLLLFSSFVLVNIETVNAIDFNPNVTIPGSKFEHDGTDQQLSKDTSPIAQYMRALYNWGIGIVGVLAGVALIIAGMMWLTAGGNNAQVEAAKKWIGGALSGLVLALGSYFLLYQINPGLVSFSTYKIIGVDVGAKGGNVVCYYYQWWVIFPVIKSGESDCFETEDECDDDKPLLVEVTPNDGEGCFLR